MGFDGYEDLVGPSEALAELHALAVLLARFVTETRSAAVLVPPGLTRLAEEAAGRASVGRRLAELRAAA